MDVGPTGRTEMAMGFWRTLESTPGLSLDVSHYNTLLKVHLDNGHAFSPTEFLAWMEEKGVAPNR